MADFLPVPRHLEGPLRQALGSARVVFLGGARQTGKSTLVRALAEGPPVGPRDYLTLDDAGVLTAAKNDPAGFIAGLRRPVVIDEVQRAPELFLTIKIAVDRDPQPGRFLLTGSAHPLLVPRLADALVGRMQILTLWPFSQGEIEGTREGFVDAVFGADAPVVSHGISRTDAVARIVKGGYPEPVVRGAGGAWYGSYITTLLQRDVRDLSRIEQIGVMPPLLELLAARAASLLNTAELSRTAALPHNTVRRYLTLLDTLLISDRLPAWSGSPTKRLAKAPKLLLTDTGLMAHLLRTTPEHVESAPTVLGPLLEDFVMMEIRKQSGWSRTPVTMFHYRSHAGDEVDLVLEGPRGMIVGIEVKAARTISTGDLRGLHALETDRPKRFHRGLVLYPGDAVIPFGPRLHAVPLNALWSWGSVPVRGASRRPRAGPGRVADVTRGSR